LSVASELLRLLRMVRSGHGLLLVHRELLLLVLMLVVLRRRDHHNPAGAARTSGFATCLVLASDANTKTCYATVSGTARRSSG
jgi:hypothetical protein